MNIIYVVSEFDPVEIAVSVRTKANVDALERDGHVVSVLTGPASKNHPKYQTYSVGISPPSNKSRFVVRLVRECLFGLAAGWRILLSRGCDQVVITSPPFVMAIICAWFARIRKIPYTIDVRDRYPQVMFSLGMVAKEGGLGRLLRILERQLYEHASHVVTVTDGLVETIEKETGVVPVHLVMNGYGEQIFDCSKQNAPEEKPIIIMHGNFGKFFDEEVFIKIAKELGKSSIDHQIVVIGMGSKIDILKQAKLPNVKILDSMTQQGIGQWLRRAYIGLSIHSDNESMRKAFPVKIFEYLGCCLPSVVLPLNEGGLLVQSEGMGYVFSPFGWTEMVEKIKELLEDKKQYQLIRETIRKRRSHFSREYQSKIFAEVVMQTRRQ